MTTCSADNKVAQTLAVAALAASVPLATPEVAMADVAGLTPCKDSAAFKKLEKKEIKALNRRLKQVCYSFALRIRPTAGTSRLRWGP